MQALVALWLGRAQPLSARRAARGSSAWTAGARGPPTPTGCVRRRDDAACVYPRFSAAGRALGIVGSPPGISGLPKHPFRHLALFGRGSFFTRISRLGHVRRLPPRLASTVLEGALESVHDDRTPSTLRSDLDEVVGGEVTPMRHPVPPSRRAHRQRAASRPELSPRQPEALERDGAVGSSRPCPSASWAPP
jgi:hypothetical protein